MTAGKRRRETTPFEPGRPRRGPTRGRMPLGRGPEVETLAAAGAGLYVLRGAAGSGRSTVLDQVARRADAQGRPVLRIAAAEAAHDDRYGAGALLDAVRSGFEILGGRPAIARAVADLDRAYAAAGGGADHRSALVVALARLVHVLRDHHDLVLLVDDADALAMPFTMPGAAATAGHLVVAAVRDDDVRGELLELVDNADHVVDLPPLAESDVAGLLARHARRSLAPSVFDSIASALGNLAGNPAAVLGAIDELLDRGRLVDVHGYLSPSSDDVLVLLPADHPAVTAVAALGEPASVVLLAASCTDFTLDGLPVLAEATGRSTAEYGEAVDRLVLLGAFEDDDRRLAVACPALADTVAERFGQDRAEALHADIVRIQTSPVRSMAFPPAVLTDHVVAAGDALPADPSLQSLLTTEAVRAEDRDPDQATARYRAARRHAAPDARPAVTTRLQQHLQRTGSYRDLGDLVADIVRETPPTGARRSELAALAGLAALHLGVDVDDDVRDALDDGPHGSGPLHFHRRWAAAESAVSVHDVEAAFRALPPFDPMPTGQATSGAVGPRTGLEPDLAEAIAVRDLVPVFEALFPRAYRKPRSGPTADHHQLLVAQAAGRWTEALTIVRRFVASGTGDMATREAACFVAAEILAWQRKDRASRQWLSGARPDSPYAVYYAWIEHAMLGGHDAKEDHAPLVAGRDLYLRSCAAPWPGPAWRLLLRMTVLALRHDLRSWLGWLLDEVRTLSRRDLGSLATLYAAALGPLLDGRMTGVAAAIHELRQRGRLLDVAFLCLAAGLVDDEPAPWLLEGRAIAAGAQAERLVAHFRAAMIRRGVTAQRVYSDRLTTAEHDLVTLVRRGMTNRQIAGELHLSVKTVENNLTRLFAKLGCRTRYGLAALDLDGAVA